MGAPSVLRPPSVVPPSGNDGPMVAAAWAPSPKPEAETGGGHAEGLAALRAALEADTRTRGRFVAGSTLELQSSSRRITVDLVCQRAALVIEVVDHRMSDLHAHRRHIHRDLLLQLDGWVVLRVLAADASSDAKRVVSLVAGAMMTRLGRA